MGLKIERATVADFQDIWKLRCLEHREEVEVNDILKMPDSDAIACKVHETNGWLLGLDGVIVIYAKDGDTPVGFTVVAPGRFGGNKHNVWQVLALFVVDSRRGSPVAFRLVRAAMRVFRAARASCVQAVISDGNKVMTKFVLKSKARRVGVIWEGCWNEQRK